MKTITETLQLATSQLHNKRTTALSRNLSARQKTEAEKFLSSFPSANDLLRFFAPSYWPYALAHTSECLAAPSISLAQVDELYHAPGTAQNIVKAQFVGIYSLSTAREPLNEQASSLAAGMFLARYGNVCNTFDLLLYFSLYQMQFKTSYAQYDLQDIIFQFGNKFLAWKRSKYQQDEQEPTTHGILLEEMVLRWVREGRTDEDFHEGGLYQIGRITDAMIRSAREQYAAELAEGCF